MLTYPNNGNETKSDIFAWDIFKSDTILFKVNHLIYIYSAEVVRDSNLC